MKKTSEKPYRGKYLLCFEDDGVYSTDSYELYILYLKMFDPLRYKNEMNQIPSDTPVCDYSKSSPANHDSFVIAMQQEILLYENGFIPERLKTKNGSKTVWIKNQKKADIILKNSNFVKKFKNGVLN